MLVYSFARKLVWKYISPIITHYSLTSRTFPIYHNLVHILVHAHFLFVRLLLNVRSVLLVQFLSR